MEGMYSMTGSLWVWASNLLLYALINLPVAMLLYPITRRMTHEPFNGRDFFWCALLMCLNFVSNRLITMWINGLNIVSSLLFFLVLLRFVYRQRGWQLMVGMVKVVVLLSVAEVLCMLIFALMGMLGFDKNKLMVLSIADLLQWENMCLFSLLNSTAFLLVLGCMLLWTRLRSPKPAKPTKNWLYIRSVIRLLALIIASLGMLTMPFALFGQRTLLSFIIENLKEYTLLTIFSACLMVIAFSYMLQDIRYILQLQRLTTLEQQQAISRSLLQNLRYFRHNMVNMLYGLEGVLISGDREKVTEYYNEMRERCALVNNENITALERVSNPSVSAVLLRGVDRARQLNLPINLYVQPEVRMSRVLSDSELCQVLGVLQDNAIEAAVTAEEQHVSIEMRNVDDGLEILVKNTYAGQVSPETLTHGGLSTKEGHEGHGLSSCYDILKRRKGAFLNFWVTGQYVQAQLLLWR